MISEERLKEIEKLYKKESHGEYRAYEEIPDLIAEIYRLRDVLKDIAELNNPYKVRYIMWPASDYINKARQALEVEVE